MSTSIAASARAHARAMIERALISERGAGGVAAAFDQLERRLRRYGPALTAEDFDDIRSYMTARMGAVCELLTPRPPDRVWSESNADPGEDPPA